MNNIQPGPPYMPILMQTMPVVLNSGLSANKHVPSQYKNKQTNKKSASKGLETEKKLA